MKTRIATPVLLAVTLLAASAPAQRTVPPTKRLGKTVVQWQDDSLKAVLGWRWANAYAASSPWMILDFFFAAQSGRPVTIAREDVSLVFPNGERVPLPSQKRLVKELRTAPAVFKQFEVARDPLGGYFPSAIREQRLRFFAVPNDEVTFDEAVGSRETVTYGPLLFPSPTGAFAEGEYRLEIRNRDVDASLPFRIPADEPGKPKKDGDPKVVSW